MQPTKISAQKPAAVVWGIRLLYAALVSEVVYEALYIARMASEAPPSSELPTKFVMLVLGFAILIMIFTLGVALFLIVMISQRRNWAKITFLVLFLLSLPLLVLSYSTRFSWVENFDIAATILQSIAVWLLYVRSASEWFKGREVKPEAG